MTLSLLNECGYPALYAKILSGNTSIWRNTRQAVEGGLPTIAECGGFLYLHTSLDGMPKCGVIDGAGYETKRLQRFGYIMLTANRENLLCKAGGSIRSNEYHYRDSHCPGNDFSAQQAGRDISYPCVHATDTLYAGFPHQQFLPISRSR